MAQCQNINRSPGDIVLNTVLLLTIAFAYGRQIHRLNTSKTNLELSPFFILYNTLFATTQYSNYLLFSCYRYPVLSCIAKRELCTLDAYAAILGLLQVAFIWLGSVMLLISYVKSSHQRVPVVARISITVIATIHTVFLLVPTTFYALPYAADPALKNPASNVMILISRIRDPFALAWCVLALISQVLRSRTAKEFAKSPSWHGQDDQQQQQQQRKVLDSVLAWQAVCFITVGLAWVMRMNRTSIGEDDVTDAFTSAGYGIRELWSWYMDEAWPWFNWLLFGLGQAALVCVAWRREREKNRRLDQGYVMLQQDA
ncbi:MAG: hypothetical protein Q9160_003544 [Pyrenula sp. 1 TL-2023]